MIVRNIIPWRNNPVYRCAVFSYCEKSDPEINKGPIRNRKSKATGTLPLPAYPGKVADAAVRRPSKRPIFEQSHKP